jgi:hypothetical protein
MRSTRQILSLMLACIFVMVHVPGCETNRETRSVPPPAVDDTVGYNNQGPVGYSETPVNRDNPNYDYDTQARESQQPQQRSGMSTRTKAFVVLAGAAALYYLYKKHKDAKATEGVDGQYYLSKNGRVYYRDAEHRAHWVTPPPQGISVPAEEAAEYREFQGYNNQPTGRDLRGLATDGAY